MDVDINKGNFDKPLSFAELEQKFLNNANLALKESEAKALLEQILSLEKQTSFL